MLGSAPDKHDAVRMSVWNVMYSMDIIRKHNIEFPSERIFISEDIIWDSEYYKYAKKANVISSTAYNYRITPGSLTQKYKPDMLEKICVLYSEMCNRLSNDEIKITRLQRQFFVNLRACIRNCQYHVVNTVSGEYLQVIQQGKQKLFVWAVRHKCVGLLYFINKIGRL